MFTTHTMKELLTRVVGMQTGKARRTATETTYDVLTMCGISARRHATHEHTIVTADVEISLDTNAVTLHSWVLDGPLHLRKDTSPSDIVTVVQGLSLLTENIIASYTDEDTDHDDYPDTEHDAYSDTGHDDYPDYDPDGFNHRFYAIAQVGSRAYVVNNGNGDDGNDIDQDTDTFHVPADDETCAWTRSTNPPQCCGNAMTEHTPDLHIGPGGIFAERIFSCPSCLLYRYVDVTDYDEKELLHSEADKW